MYFANLAIAAASKDDMQCALQIISLASECGIDNLARTTLLKSVCDMPEGVELVKWLYTILVKSMSKNSYIQLHYTYTTS